MAATQAPFSCGANTDTTRLLKNTQEFLRLWFRDNCDPYNDDELPDAPAELVAELSRRYVLLY